MSGVAEPVLPPDAEIGANFWFITIPEGMITRLLARFYVLLGDESDKLEVLRSAAATDWVIARQFEVPARFHAKVGLLRRSVPVTPVAAWRIDAMMPLFEDAAKVLESELPGFCTLTFPEDPLTCFTPVKQTDDNRLLVSLDGVHRF